MKYRLLLPFLTFALLSTSLYGLTRTEASGPNRAVADPSAHTPSGSTAAVQQSNKERPGALTGPQAGAPEDVALAYLRTNAAKLGLRTSDLAELGISDQYTDKRTGITYIYFQQQVGGIGVFKAILNVTVMPDGRVLHVGNRGIPNLLASINAKAPQLSAEDAVRSAASKLNITVKAPLQVVQKTAGPAQAVVFNDAGISLREIPVKLVYQPVAKGDVRLAWDLSIEQLDAEHYWSLRIDALTGDLLSQIDLVVHENWDAGIAEDGGLDGDVANLASAHQHAAPHAHAAAPRPQLERSASALNSTSALTGTYMVFSLPMDSPYDGPRSMVVNPADPDASPFGWHDTNGAAGPDRTDTYGNNVRAYTDQDDDDAADPGSAPNGGPTLNFSFPLDLEMDPTTYTSASVTNLFYWNNIIHDVLYQYGFDEPAGNFQINNYGRGGLQNDRVAAEALDGSGTNNANFSTPADGSFPRMQMYRWLAPLTELVMVNTPLTLSGVYSASQSGFGPQLEDTGPITGNLVLALDADDPSDGGLDNACDEIINANEVAGNIAIVRRGTCALVDKVLNAQAAGAIALIVVNNTGAPPSAIGGTNPIITVTIPAVMIWQDIGLDLIDALPGANATLMHNFDGEVLADRDSDLDNGIITHEYGHGVSNRLTGGPNTIGCLNNEEQMGEGWSDFLAVVFTALPTQTAETPRGVGTYSSFDPPNGDGIRLAPYTTDMSINTYTYEDRANAEVSIPHGVGFIWNTMLWEMYWNLVDAYGFDEDLYDGTGGNNLALQLVLDGMKMQACDPGFVDGRDAILAADLAMGGANQCMIWSAFAKRGLGYSADQGSSESIEDGEAAFDMPPFCEAGYSFILDVQPDSINACVLDGLTATVSVGRAITYTEAISLAAMGLPPGYSAMFMPNPVATPTMTSTLMLSSTGIAMPGTYSVTVQGTSMTATQTDTLVLNLSTPLTATTTLITPVEADPEAGNVPFFSWTEVPQATSYLFELATTPAFTDVVFTEETEFDFLFLQSAELQLNFNQTYYWRVTPRSFCGDGQTSAVASFNVGPEPGICETPTNVTYQSSFEDGAPGWTLGDGSIENTWMLTDVRAFTGDMAWHATDLDHESDQRLISPPIDVPGAEENPVLRFMQYQAFEEPLPGFCWDGAILEISTNGGISWTQVIDELLTDPYDKPVFDGSNPLSELLAWCPNHTQEWYPSVVDLSTYAGETVHFRFRLGTDEAAGAEGWYIDDVTVQSCEVEKPNVVIMPESLDDTLMAGEQATHTLTISNSGSVSLTWSIHEEGVAAPTKFDLGIAPQIAPQVEALTDGSFETTNPQTHMNPYWEGESDAFTSPFYPQDARTGEWAAWIDGRFITETASFWQRVTIPDDAANLRFWLMITPGEFVTGTGVLTVTIDSTPIFTITEAGLSNHGNYAPIEVDLADFADGGSHDLRFSGWATNLSFVVDDVSLDVTCDSASDIPWVMVSPISGTTAPNSMSMVDVVFDATGLTTGNTYTGTLCVETNDVAHPITHIPLSLTIGEQPEVEVSVEMISETLEVGDIVTQSFQLSNTSSVPVEFVINEIAVQGLKLAVIGQEPVSDTLPWLIATPMSGTIMPNETITVMVMIDTMGLAPGGYSGILEVETDSAGTFNVTVIANVSPVSCYNYDTTDSIVDIGDIQRVAGAFGGTYNAWYDVVMPYGTIDVLDITAVADAWQSTCN